uniref:Uncharacterized protein n=1 Tax=Anguilla anguilla TaxID=7936 RepID=A0A0E9SPR9_ANGAN
MKHEITRNFFCFCNNCNSVNFFIIIAII